MLFVSALVVEVFPLVPEIKTTTRSLLREVSALGKILSNINPGIVAPDLPNNFCDAIPADLAMKTESFKRTTPDLISRV